MRKGKGNAANFNKFYSELAPYYDLEDEYDDTLIFESRFESGNLGEAYRVGEYEYNLYMQDDTGEGQSKQWFYFKVSNITKGAKYRFNINNMQSKESMYRHGMKPLFYSNSLI